MATITVTTGRPCHIESIVVSKPHPAGWTNGVEWLDINNLDLSAAWVKHKMPYSYTGAQGYKGPTLINYLGFVISTSNDAGGVTSLTFTYPNECQALVERRGERPLVTAPSSGFALFLLSPNTFDPKLMPQYYNDASLVGTT
jgi:hypothetical protein